MLTQKWSLQSWIKEMFSKTFSEFGILFPSFKSAWLDFGRNGTQLRQKTFSNLPFSNFDLIFGLFFASKRSKEVALSLKVACLLQWHDSLKLLHLRPVGRSEILIRVESRKRSLKILNNSFDVRLQASWERDSQQSRERQKEKWERATIANNVWESERDSKRERERKIERERDVRNMLPFPVREK